MIRPSGIVVQIVLGGWLGIAGAARCAEPPLPGSTTALVDGAAMAAPSLTPPVALATPPAADPVALPPPVEPPAVVPPDLTVGAGRVAFGGLIQLQHLASFASGSRPDLRVRRAEFKLRGDLVDGFGWGLVLDGAMVADDGFTSAVILSSSTTGKPISAITALGRASPLKEAWVAADRPVRALPWFKRFQAGQFKVPFGMEGLKSAGDLEFVERSMQASILKWTDARDLGAQVLLGAGPMDLTAGAFQGEGQNRADRNNFLNTNVRAVARVTRWLALGAAWQTGRTGPAKELADRSGAELAGEWTIAGRGVRLRSEAAQGAQGPRGKAAGIRTGYGSLGVDCIPNRVEFGVRFDWLDLNRHRSRDWRTEATAGITLKAAKGRVKAQCNFVRVDEASPKVRDDMIRTSLQASF